MANVLVVDDSWLSRQMIARILQKKGHNVLHAKDGKEGLEKAVSENPDCIVLDLLMPEMNGFDFLGRMLDKEIKTPVVVLSADIQDSSRAECMELGAIGFLNKPPKEEDLFNIVAETTRAMGDGPTATQTEALRALIEVGVRRGADVLNNMLNAHIAMEVPVLKVLKPEEFRREIRSIGKGRLTAVSLTFKGAFSGTAQLLFPTGTAAKLVAALTGDEAPPEDLDAIRAGTLCEIGNIVLNGVMGSLSNLLGLRFHFRIPEHREGSVEELVVMASPGGDTSILLAHARFTVEELQIEGSIVLYFDVGGYDALLRAVDAAGEDAPDAQG